MADAHLTDVSFTNLHLPEPLARGIADAGFERCTPIQAQTLPRALAGFDVAGQAQTGTGKTAAFVLPALQRLAASGSRASAGRNGVATPRILVLAPTRELAQQVAEQAVRYGRSLKVNTVCIYGGAPYPIQNRELARGADIIVATPGRLIDHLERGRIDLSALEVLVLDEADRMLDMGFVDDVELALDPAHSVIQVRSAARVGVRDFGVNRARVEALRAALAAALSR